MDSHVFWVLELRFRKNFTLSYCIAGIPCVLATVDLIISLLDALYILDAPSSIFKKWSSVWYQWFQSFWYSCLWLLTKIILFITRNRSLNVRRISLKLTNYSSYFLTSLCPSFFSFSYIISCSPHILTQPHFISKGWNIPIIQDFRDIFVQVSLGM